MEVVLGSLSKFHVDVMIKSDDGHWRFTGFYGDPKVSNKIHSWNLLRRLNDLSTLPWVVGGDFNEIVCMEEKKGGVDRNQRQMQAF